MEEVGVVEEGEDVGEVVDVKNSLAIMLVICTLTLCCFSVLISQVIVIIIALYLLQKQGNLCL